MNTFDRQFYEFNPETEALEAEQFEWGGQGELGAEAEWGGEAEVFNEAETMELAGEMLEISSEAELDRFLGDLINKAGRALGQVVKSPIGQVVGGFLKGAAKKAIPLAGAALGGYFGGPLGAKIGSGLGNLATDALGLEAETMNAEDREFEGAKRFVRMAGDAVKSAVAAQPGVNPALLAQSAVTAAARKYLPTLLGAGGRPSAQGATPQQYTGHGMGQGMGYVGRWVRRGSNIIIVNCQPGRA